MKDVKDCASTPNNGCDVIPGQFLLHVGQLKYFKMLWFRQKTRVINDLVACSGCPRCEHSSVFCLHAVWAFAHHGFGSAYSFLECSGSANTSTAIVHLGNSYDPICRETVRVWNYTRTFFFFAARTFPIACRRGQTEAGQFAMSGDWKRSCTNHVCVCLRAVLLCKLSAPQTGRLQACKRNLHGLTCIIAPCVHLYDAVPSAEKCHVRCPAPSHIYKFQRRSSSYLLIVGNPANIY